MPLKRRVTETLPAVSHRKADDEEALFARLHALARDPILRYDCAVQGADREFAVILSEPDGGGCLSAWWGSADSIAGELEKWLEDKVPKARAQDSRQNTDLP
jgi:hypothetical protein